MGYELRRYLADMAPPKWSPDMRLVAYEIADRSPDPKQADPGDMTRDGAIRSRVLLEGHLNRRNEYVKGLTDYCGKPARWVSRQLQALSESGYEMRIQLRDRDADPLFDNIGRPVFAVKGRAMRFQVPPIGSLPVENPAPPEASMGVRSDTHRPEWVSASPPIDAERVSDLTPVFPTEDLSLVKTLPTPPLPADHLQLEGAA